MKIKRRTLTLLTWWSSRLTVIGVVIGIFYSYFYTQFFTVTTYQISGIDDESRVSIDTQLHALDTQKIYKVFPLDKIFTYSNTMITTTVRTIVPEAATVDMRPLGLHTIKIDVTLLKPLFKVSDTQAVTVDGTIFSTKYDLGTYPFVTIASSTTRIIKNDGLPFTQLVLPDGGDSTDFFTQVSSLSSKISSLIFPVTSIVVESTGNISCFNASGTSKVIFLKDSDPKKVWSTLVSAIDTDPLKTKLATNKVGLEYLDARYGNKVFYRFNDMTFQNGTVTGILGNHATSTQEAVSSTSTFR